MERKKLIKAITEGAIYVAIYGILAVLSNTLVKGVDSIMYYLAPLPIALYSSRQKIGLTISCFFASIAICFLFTNYMYVLMLFVPNILIGLIFGLLESRIKFRILNYIITFVLCIGADFLSIYLFEKLEGVSYWQETIDMAVNLFDSFGLPFSTDFIKELVEIASVIIIIIDSLMKTILLGLIFVILVVRLKLIEDFKLQFKIPLSYSPFIAILYILLFLVFIIIGYNLTAFTFVIKFVITIVGTLMLILSFYLIYQFCFFARIKFSKMKSGVFALIIIGAIILFPISIITSIVLNLISYNFVLDSLK